MILAVVHKQTGEKIYEAEHALRNYYGNKDYQLVRDTGLFDVTGVPIVEGDIVSPNEDEVRYTDGAFWVGTERLTGYRITELKLTVIGHIAVATVMDQGKYYENRYDKVHALVYVKPIRAITGMLCEGTNGSLQVIKDSDFKFYKQITKEEFLGCSHTMSG